MEHRTEHISFIIPAYNCALVVQQAVQSIYDGNFQNGDEVVLIDDCSTDDTARMLKVLQRENEALRVLSHRQNRGTAAASRNTGIEAAANDLIFCLDADNVLVPQSVGGLRDYLRMKEADAAAFGEIHYFQTTPEEVTHKWLYPATVSLADALCGAIWPGPSGNYLFTRESWLRAGRYMEPYLENRSLDSWMFAIRQLGTGSRMVTLPQSWYYHRYGHDSHYVQNWQRGNQSLAALMAITPFLDRIEDEDVEYLFSREGRYVWYERLNEHPVRLKRMAPGQGGRIETLQMSRLWRARRFAARLLQKVRKRLGIGQR